MKRAFMYLLALVLTSGLVLPLTAQEKPLKKADVPKAVLSSFEKAYPHATAKGYSGESKDGKTVYEVESVEGKTHRDILYAADGTVLEIEEGMKVSDLPEEVRAAVKREYPNGSIASAEKLTKGESTQYEVVVKHGKKKTEMKIDPSGKVLEKE
jgi:uncharacterized membrane protein YkoI